MERERKGIITWMLFISACLIISLVFNVKACMLVKPPPAKPTTEYKHMNKEQLLRAYDSIYAITAPDDPARYRYSKETIFIDGKDSIFIVDNYGDVSK